MESISRFGPALFHGTLHLALLAAALRALFLWLKQRFPQKNGPSHKSSPDVVINFWSSLDKLDYYIPQLHIVLSSCLLLDILSAILMYGPFEKSYSLVNTNVHIKTFFGSQIKANESPIVLFK